MLAINIISGSEQLKKLIYLTKSLSSVDIYRNLEWMILNFFASKIAI